MNCKYCTRPVSTHGTRMFQTCGNDICKRKLKTDADKARRQRLLKSRVCVDCGQISVNEGRVRCTKCLASAYARHKKSRALRKTKGKCIIAGCKELQAANRTMCKSHLKRRAAYEKKKKIERADNQHLKELSNRARKRTAVDAWLGRLPT